MALGEFSNLITAIQGLLISLTIIVGGVWALFRFRTLRESERASAELARLRDELQREPAVSISLTANVIGPLGGLPTTIHAVLGLKNIGKAPDVIDWSSSGLAFARVIDFSDSTPAFDRWRTTKLVTDSPWKGADVQPGEESAYGFLIPAPNCGVYCIEAFIKLSPRSTEASSAAIRNAGMYPQAMLEASAVIFVPVALLTEDGAPLESEKTVKADTSRNAV